MTIISIGNYLCFASHDCSVVVVDFTTTTTTAEPVTRVLRHRDLPICSLLFLSDVVVVAGGHDFEPIVFGCNNNNWKVVARLCKPSSDATTTTTTTLTSAARELFKNKTVRGQEVCCCC